MAKSGTAHATRTELGAPAGADATAQPACGVSLGADGGVTHAPFASQTLGSAHSEDVVHFSKQTPAVEQPYGAHSVLPPSMYSRALASQRTLKGEQAPRPSHSLPNGPTPTAQPAHDVPRA